MIKLTKDDVKELVGFMEYLMDNESKIMVSELMKKFGITFDDYRLLCDLTMPAIRRKNELSNMKARCTYFKTARNKYRDKLEKVEDALGIAHQYFHLNDDERITTQEEALAKASNWLDEYFKPADTPVVKKPDESDTVEDIDKELMEGFIEAS